MNTTLSGKTLLDALAIGFAGLLTHLMEQVFGPGVHTRIAGSTTWADLGVLVGLLVLVLLINGIAASFLRRQIRKAEAEPESREWRVQLWATVGRPLYLLIWIYGVYLVATPLLAKYSVAETVHPVRQLLNTAFDLGVFVVLVWLFFRFTRVLELRLKTWAATTSSRLDDLFVPLLGRSLRVIVPVVGLILAMPMIGLSPESADVLAKISSILVIGAVSYVLFQAVHLGEKAIMARYDINAADNLQARKIYTQVHILAKTLYVVIGIFTIASVLMLFDEVRRLGTSILASAGVVGIIIGFAAQRTIANLFAGFQLAMTQPIRIDDVVIVENEWGRVEEITLTYIVIRIWDERRLVVPLSYFIEKPFQNWTRTSSSLLGSVFFWADYRLPLAELRELTRSIVEGNPLWDKRFWNLQITDTSERAMQVRVLATAADSGKAWTLRCEIREQLLETIQKRFPEGLPRTRVELEHGGNRPPSESFAPGGGPVLG